MKTILWGRKELRQVAGTGLLFLTACVGGANARQTNGPANPAAQSDTSTASLADTDPQAKARAALQQAESAQDARQTNAPANPAAQSKAPATSLTDAEPLDLNNWVEVGVGGNVGSGSKAEYQKQADLPARTAYGGITAFHYETPVDKKGLFSLDGRGIYDNHDYKITLGVEHPDLGYVRAGIRQYREYYDGAGGYLPSNGAFFPPATSALAIDRGTAFFEAGLTLPDWPVLKIRYEHDSRTGEEDSTEWGTTTLTGPGGANNATATGQKKIAPAYRSIDEKTDSIAADLTHTLKNTDFGVGVRYDWIRNNDVQNSSFFPGQINAQGDSHVMSQVEGDKNNMFNAHAFTDTKFNDKWEFTSGYSYTAMQDRIFGSRLDDPLVAVGADTMFANLAGDSDMEQYEMNVNLMYTPVESLYIISAARVEKEDLAGWSSDNAVTGSAAVPITPVLGALTSNGDSQTTLNVAESLEIRYTGITNLVLYIRGELEENQANLAELQQTLPAAPSTALDSDWHQTVQKYTFGANWYPLRRLNFSAQYYHKIDDNNYENNPSTPGAYPGFINQENFIEDDANFRMTLRPMSQLTLISTYDFKYTTVDMQGYGLGVIQSANTTTHMIGENISWTPFNRVYVQLGVNYVLDTTHTPADSLNEPPIAGVPISGVVQPSQNNYWTLNGTIGYAINDKTQLSASYVYYRSSDYSDNSAIGLPYGADGEQHNVSAKLTRQITPRLRWALTYSFASYRDGLFGGNLDYTAHSVLSSLRYQF